MKRILPIFFCLFLCSCSEGLSIPKAETTRSLSQATNSASIASETPVVLYYPPCAPEETDQLAAPTPAIPDSAPRKLADGLTIEEYRSFVYHVHLQDSGCIYDHFLFTDTKININSSYQIIFQPLDMQTEMIRVLKEGNDIYDAKTFTYGSSGLVQAWSYNDHWVIEIKNEFAEYGIDIIRDGQSLKKANKYDSIMAFQILNNHPFFFFRRSGKWGINYDDKEIQLNYDKIPYTNVSDGMDPSIVQYQNMVLFQAERNSKMYTVVIGAFH